MTVLRGQRFLGTYGECEDELVVARVDDLAPVAVQVAALDAEGAVGQVVRPIEPAALGVQCQGVRHRQRRFGHQASLATVQRRTLDRRMLRVAVRPEQPSANKRNGDVSVSESVFHFRGFRWSVSKPFQESGCFGYGIFRFLFSVKHGPAAVMGGEAARLIAAEEMKHLDGAGGVG